MITTMIPILTVMMAAMAGSQYRNSDLDEYEEDHIYNKKSPYYNEEEEDEEDE